MKIQNINLSRTSKEVPYERRKSTKTRHISTSFTLLNLLNLSLNSLNLKDRKVWKLYRDDTTTTTTVYINRQKGILTWKVDTNLDRRIIFTNFNLNSSSNHPDSWHGQQSQSNFTQENIYNEDISKEDNYESKTMVLTTQTVVNDRKVVKLTFLTRTSS